MSVGRRTDGLLNASATVRLLQLLASGPVRSDELEQHLRILENASIARTKNSVALFAELGLLRIENSLVATEISAVASKEVEGAVRERLETYYFGFLEEAPLGSLFQLREDKSHLWVDRLQLPGRELGLPYLLLEFNVFRRDGYEDRFWRVSSQSREGFLQLIKRVNQSTTAQMTLRGLKSLRKAKEEAGWRAEQFVVEYERLNRSRHPLVESIRSISDENVSAGFDVLSFETDTTLIHDKFIEVKSFASEKVFYWSAGEITAAEELQDRYWLYLVDRDQMDRPGYRPEKIQNPHVHFILREDESWIREEQGYKFTAVLAQTAAS